jgi:hypothetical protein
VHGRTVAQKVQVLQGVDVMIANFCHFCRFSAKKIGAFLKNQCYDYTGSRCGSAVKWWKWEI